MHIRWTERVVVTHEGHDDGDEDAESSYDEIHVDVQSSGHETKTFLVTTRPS